MSTPHDPFPEDHLKKMRQLARQLDPLKHLRDAMKLASPLAAHMDTLDPLAKHRNFLDPLAALKGDHARGALKEIERLAARQNRDLGGTDALFKAQQSQLFFDPMAEHRKLQGVLDMLHSHRDAMKTFDPLGDVRRSLESIEPLRKYGSMMSSVGSLRLLDRVLNQPLESWALAAKEESSHLRRMLEAISSAQHDLHRVAESISEYGVDATDVSPIVIDAVRVTDSLGNATAADLVEQLVAAFHASSNPADRRTFATYVYPALLLMIGVILTPIADFYIKRNLDGLDKATPKSIKASAHQLVHEPRALEGYRFVAAQSLIVRGKAGIRSRAIGTLSFGQAIRVLEREKSWTLVEWTDSGNRLQLQGWVLSRYLSKFN